MIQLFLKFDLKLQDCAVLDLYSKRLKVTFLKLFRIF